MLIKMEKMSIKTVYVFWGVIMCFKNWDNFHYFRQSGNLLIYLFTFFRYRLITLIICKKWVPLRMRFFSNVSKLSVQPFLTSMIRYFWLVDLDVRKTNAITVTFRSSFPEVFCHKGVLKNLAIFTGKQLSLFNSFSTTVSFQ